MKNVLVIFGGISAEHDISVITGVEALHAMPSKGYKVIPIYIKEDCWYTGRGLYNIKKYINFEPPAHERVTLINKELYSFGKRGKLSRLSGVDCALIACHGGYGENGTLSGYLTMCGVPFTSAGVLESAVCMDKTLTKTVLNSIGADTVDGEEVVCPKTDAEISALWERFNVPLIIKPVSQGSSIGVSLAKNADELKEGLKFSEKFGKRVLVEKAVTDFKEINCAAFRYGGEIIVSELEKPLGLGGFLSYDDKYRSGSGMSGLTREFPANVSAEIRTKIRETTEYVYKKLNLSGVVRIDYFAAEKIYLNEINTVPGSLSHYLFPQYKHGEFLKMLIDEALTREIEKPPSYSVNILSAFKEMHK